MKIKLDDFAFEPERQHPNDAGLDLRTPYSLYIPPHSRMFINTEVHVMLPANSVGMIKSRSGLNRNKGIQCEGVIDENYTGAIGITLYNRSDDPVTFTKGDRISQLVILPCIYPEIEFVSELPKTDRGENGFGSTGKK